MVAKPKKKKATPKPIHFETTIPVIRQCARCGVWLAAGVAEGQKAQVEFVTLDLGQQLWAVMNHIELYCIRRVGLIHMGADRLAGPRLGALYPQHKCSVSWPKPPGGFEYPASNPNPPY